jgi:2-oxoglutarate dehydrogenase E1 component
MYKKIRAHPTTRQLYAEKLIREQVVTEAEVNALVRAYPQQLESGAIIPQHITDTSQAYAKKWRKYFGVAWNVPCKTAVSLERIRYCNEGLLRLPPDFELHPRVAKVMENRAKMAAGAMPLDWGFAENMAYATLLMENYNLRLTGQDVGRGTFSHRHAILLNQRNGDNYIPLKHLHANQGCPQIFNSLLSEAGVLGFEYGYSSSEPDAQVIWEAQFGDFANGAQVLIDQFISSGEAKWGRLSGLTLLLPHGLEGQGPEHSSARIERYLQLCADQNMQVCIPTTPSQIFHLLRRQMLRPYRKPLIVMTPKSLLRHKLAVSTLEDLSSGEFQPIISETAELDLSQVTRLILCSGKVYYDLLEARLEAGLNHIAIVRVEQLYPFPSALLKAELTKYSQVTDVIWCQEEPKNQGAWYQSKHHFLDQLHPRMTLRYCGRPASAAPAVGHFSEHIKQQKEVIRAALYSEKHPGKI